MKLVCIQLIGLVLANFRALKTNLILFEIILGLKVNFMKAYWWGLMSKNLASWKPQSCLTKKLI